jgi:hypothetical protein
MEARDMEKNILTSTEKFELQNQSWTLGDIFEGMKKEPGVGAPLIGSFHSRFECYAIGIQNGFLTLDEVRKLENLPEIQNGGNARG